MKRRNIFFTGLILILFFMTFSVSAQENAKSFRDCSDCPEMITLPEGDFIIGSPADETGRFNTEGPQTKVHIQALAVAKFDITRAQWSKFVAATKRETKGGCAWSGLNDSTKPWELNPRASWNHLGFQQEDDHPVVCVNLTDAEDYIQWLSKKTGKTYRLLTESEWEYAARGGTTTAYPWGNKASHEYANYGLDSGYKGTASGRDRWMETSPVGAFPPNAFGLYDMQGNVLQFVQDCFEETYAALPVDGSAYKSNSILNLQGHFKYMNGTGSCGYRAVRGGDWGDPPRMIRSAFRNWAPGQNISLNNYRSAGLGIRIARDL